jgi:TRAP-type C4-dicarboxylate transport system permease large subunit
VSGFLIGLVVAVALVLVVLELFVEWRFHNRPDEHGHQEPLGGFRRLAAALFVLVIVVGGILAMALTWPPVGLSP